MKFCPMLDCSDILNKEVYVIGQLEPFYNVETVGRTFLGDHLIELLLV